MPARRIFWKYSTHCAAMSPESTRMPTPVGLRVRPDDAQGVFQPDRLGVHQVAQQRRRAHRW